ncbi:ferritin-like domain-containing protein [Alteraurantiacibacter aquimixticola]|uniref:Ferritin-like domain-containing protein n=1 Tax=Alteraurantiacibacter aquimixticola TaxID=2489173 RepID=A0A4T3EY69_9SPHN|nr:ferritin-like domain-containing protein [Alteraurantiacibacter aquimixticola]TIX49001.1 ferritin-like domain-containing protein [Alteraurantiacibacter aquimixticola]
MSDLSTAIRATLLTGEPRAKVKATRQLVRDWRRGRLPTGFSAPMPDRPRWPDRLQLLPPSQMPKRGRGGSDKNRIALWHSLAHIEFAAIDLALDMVGRFGGEMDEAFIADFLHVAADEAMHFALIERKLASMGASYGDLPVHDGLWSAAQETQHDVAARLAVVPMVLEARGLDVTPATLERVRAQGDENGAKILERILDDEIRHVRAGSTHFARICVKRREVPEKHWKFLVRRHFRGKLKRPFNDSARLAAGLSRDAYHGLA